MCFRPSALVGSEPQVQTGECPSCGRSVAASIGIDAGTCPYCGKPIPVDSKSDAGKIDPGKNAKIL